jgi:hypothetical protein
MAEPLQHWQINKFLQEALGILRESAPAPYLDERIQPIIDVEAPRLENWLARGLQLFSATASRAASVGNYGMGQLVNQVGSGQLVVARARVTVSAHTQLELGLAHEQTSLPVVLTLGDIFPRDVRAVTRARWLAGGSTVAYLNHVTTDQNARVGTFLTYDHEVYRAYIYTTAAPAWSPWVVLTPGSQMYYGLTSANVGFAVTIEGYTRKLLDTEQR